VLLILN